MGKEQEALAVTIARDILKGVNSGGLVELSVLPPVERTVGEDRLEWMIIRRIDRKRSSTLGIIIEYGIAADRAEAEGRTPFTSCWRRNTNFSADGMNGRMGMNFLAYAVIRAAIADELKRMVANAAMIIPLSPE